MKMAFVYAICIVTMIFAIIVMSHYAHGDLDFHYKEKICMMSISEGEIALCFFGDPESANTMWNKVQQNNNISIYEMGAIFDYLSQMKVSKSVKLMDIEDDD